MKKKAKLTELTDKDANLVSKALRRKLRDPAELDKIVNGLLQGSTSQDNKERLSAISEVLDRAYGRPGAVQTPNKSPGDPGTQNSVTFEVIFVNPVVKTTDSTACLSIPPSTITDIPRVKVLQQ